MHPQRGPRRPQQPIFGTFLRGGLHCEHYTTSSPDLTATRLGELHDMRVRHAGSTPLGGFMECKTPTTGGVEGAGRTVHPAGAPASAKKLAQHRPYTGLSAKKFAQQAQRHQIWGVLSAQGELFRAFAITQRRRANFFALAPTLGRAGRQISCTARRNMATLKPATPLLAPNKGPLKPTAPLRAFNTRKTSIFPAQRRHRFQASAHTRLQRCHRFHRDEAVH